jgi:Alpha/beta hydrolase domain
MFWTMRQERLRRLLAGIAAVSFAAYASASAGSNASAVAAPAATVSGPISGGGGVPVVSTTAFDLRDVGYEQSEFLLAGTASKYSPTTPLTSDGRWSVTPSDPQAYTTRLVVYRPTNAKKFNGSVVVEWLNVSGGVDAGPDWVMTHTELVRDGFAWVGVSAQAAGINSSKSTDAVRYASIAHPGDSYSYDIYSQAGRAVRDSTKVLGGLRPRTVIAAGESQSAARMVTYIDALGKTNHIYDGFLVHSRSATGAPLQGSPPPPVGAAPPGPAPMVVPTPTAIRGDLKVPVLVLETETDVFNSNTAERQPDTKNYRLWEVAGTSHYDAYGLTIGTTDPGGRGAARLLALMQHPSKSAMPGIIECNLPINTGPAHWVLNVAVYSLNRWVTKGIAPPIAPRLQTTTTAPVVFARDSNGNAMGGIRSPQVDVPIAVLGGTTNSGSPPLGQFCRLFGTTVPLTAPQLTALYKSHDDFVAKWKQSIDRAVKAGFLLQPDAKELQSAASNAPIPQ